MSKPPMHPDDMQQILLGVYVVIFVVIGYGIIAAAGL